MKRRAEADVEAANASHLQQQTSPSSSSPFTKRSPLKFASRPEPSDVTAIPIVLARQVDIRAYGLEDRAEAVIAMGKSTWTLANLSQWRNDSLTSADAESSSNDPIAQQQQSSKEYLRQRQRAYMKQCLANNKAPLNQQ